MSVDQPVLTTEKTKVIIAPQAKSTVKKGVAKKALPSKTKLTYKDKARILELTKNNISIEEIAKDTQKSVKAVQNYLGPIKEALILNEAVEVKSSSKVSPALFEKVLNKLQSAGLEGSYAKTSMNNLINKMSDEELKSVDEALLYNGVINSSRVNMLMIKKAAGGRIGLSVMTQQASEAIDTLNKQNIGHTQNQSIFRSH